MSGRTNKATLVERLQAVTSILQRQTSVKAAAKRLKVSHSTIENWLRAYRTAGVTGLEKTIKKQLGNTTLKVVILELHFDGHSGDYLLIYVSTGEKVFLAGIGTHSDLF